jgi:hypothetical protein
MPIGFRLPFPRWRRGKDLAAASYTINSFEIQIRDSHPLLASVRWALRNFLYGVFAPGFSGKYLIDRHLSTA